MNSSTRHCYRIRSPLNSPRNSTNRADNTNHDNPTTRLSLPMHDPTQDISDQASDSDSDTIIDDSGRDGFSTPKSRDASVPPLHHHHDPAPRFAGLHDETFPEQSIAATIPYEIIFNIFRFLEPFSADNYKCLFVCKAWTKCAVESVWFRPAIKDIGVFLKFTSSLPSSTRKPTTLFPYAQFVRRLNLLNVARELQPRHLATLAECTQLERSEPSSPAMMIR